MKYIKTNEAVKVENYPYGFSLKTTLTDTMEFNPKKGYRRVTQTVNPKNGRVNKPKKSTYYAFLIRYYDENNHIKSTNIANFDYSLEGFNKFAKWAEENFELLTSEEVEYLYMQLLVFSKVDMVATVNYKGAKTEDLIPLYDAVVKTLVQGIKSKGTENLFSAISIDKDKILAVCPANYEPFKVITYK